MLKMSFGLVVGATLILGVTPVLAAGNAGPEPYHAKDPHYSEPMQQEPLIKPAAKEVVSLGSASDIKGPDAGPEPYSAPTPKY